jgi:uncharacterized protein with PIN domain
VSAVACARCTVPFTDKEREEIEGVWVPDFYENGSDAYFCAYCASTSELLP